MLVAKSNTRFYQFQGRLVLLIKEGLWYAKLKQKASLFQAVFVGLCKLLVVLLSDPLLDHFLMLVAELACKGIRWVGLA